jgi:penicillin-binding protein 2
MPVKTGLERSYEKVLMGSGELNSGKEITRTGSPKDMEGGSLIHFAIAGQKYVYSRMDIELQELGEKLMQNKLGSVVAIDPKTGGILAMVSSALPIKPSYLTGS